MTVIVERAVVTVVRLEAPSMAEADQAFDDLRTRIGFTLPKLRFGTCRFLDRRITVHAISERGIIRGAGRNAFNLKSTK